MINERGFRLDMPFSEVLERLAQTDPEELRKSMKQWKKRRDKAIAGAPNVSKIGAYKTKLRNRHSW